MSFEDEIKKYDEDSFLNYFVKNGKNPVLLSAPHTMMQVRDDGSVKYGEPLTKNIAMYVADKMDCSYIIKNKDTGIESNHSDTDEYKDLLLSMIRNNNIKLFLDIHGAKKDREFDIELGTLNNLSADYSTINELIDAFNENGILNIEINSPFKGGSITQSVYFDSKCDAIQIEINGNYRDYSNLDNTKKVCNALMDFIDMYINIIK